MNCPGCGEKLEYSQHENNPILYCNWCKFKITIEDTGKVQTKEQFIRKAFCFLQKKQEEPFDF